MNDTERKAFKLVEALAEPCESGPGSHDIDGDHYWRSCRRCLAVAELEYGAAGKNNGQRELMRALLALRDVWVESVEPFHLWAQSYLDSSRWAGHDRLDAIKRELLQRDQELAYTKSQWTQARAEIRRLREQLSALTTEEP